MNEWVDVSELPEPDAPLDTPDLEFERLLAWFIKVRTKRLAWLYDVDEVNIEIVNHPLTKNKWKNVIKGVKHERKK